MDGGFVNFFVAGCAFAFLAVAAGAFGAHALDGRLNAEQMEWFQLAARYQMYHALALIATSYTHTHCSASRSAIAGYAFIAGNLVFSGTLYAMAFGAPRWLGAITPIGGVAFLIGWAMLCVSSTRGVEAV